MGNGEFGFPDDTFGDFQGRERDCFTATGLSSPVVGTMSVSRYFSESGQFRK